MNDLIADEIKVEITKALTECREGLVLEGIHSVIYSSNSKPETVRVLQSMIKEGLVKKGGEVGELYVLTEFESIKSESAKSTNSNVTKKITKRDRIVEFCKKPCTAGEIADKLGISKKHASVEVRALVKKGLLADLGKTQGSKFKRYLAAGATDPGQVSNSEADQINTAKANHDNTQEPSPTVLTRLHTNYLRAADDMDEYIMSMCDPDLLNQLREMRNVAKSNYESYCEKHGLEADS